MRDEFLQIIDEELSGVLNIPRKYHYVCHGGSTCGPMVDRWGDAPTAHCGNSGDGTDTLGGGGWINAPACRRGCNRMIKGVIEISENERRYNSGAERLARAIKERLESVPQESKESPATPPNIQSAAIAQIAAQLEDALHHWNGDGCCEIQRDTVKEMARQLRAL